MHLTIPAAVTHLFERNQFFSGGAVLMIAGGAVAWLMRIKAHLYCFLKDRVFISLEISSHDEVMNCLKHWLDQHPSSQRIRRLRLMTLPTSKKLERDRRLIVFSIATGSHVIRWSLRPKCWMTRA